MQPYFFPYGGYYQLIKESDLFVILDDVQYIRRGWVNRNKIREEDPIYLTVPVKKCSQKSLITEVQIERGWVDLHLKRFRFIYGKDIESHPLYRYYSSLDKWEYLSPMLANSILWTSNYLNINTRIVHSSDFPSEKKREARIIDLCKQLGGTHYLNLPGGRQLYTEEMFQKEGLKVEFIDTDSFKRISILESIFKREIYDKDN
jgi:hypothetical protein